MSLIVPTRFPNQELTEREALVRHGRTKAQKDFAQEEAENLIKKSYQEELQKLRKGETPMSQSAKPTSAPTTRKETAMDTEKKVQEMTARFMAAQSPTPEPLKQMTPSIPQPSLDTSLDPNMARRVVECWNASSEAQKDFKTLADFYDFAIASEKKNAQLPNHKKDLCGLPFYERRAKRNS